MSEQWPRREISVIWSCVEFDLARFCRDSVSGKWNIPETSYFTVVDGIEPLSWMSMRDRWHIAQPGTAGVPVCLPEMADVRMINNNYHDSYMGECGRALEAHSVYQLIRGDSTSPQGRSNQLGTAAMATEDSKLVFQSMKLSIAGNKDIVRYDVATC
ncbi:hypothetical protein BKA93DRAFT_876282 [Sparassis latifolia]